jgi:hypothetical protein
MSLKLRDFIQLVSIQLYDANNTNWSEPELLSWLEEGIGSLAAVRPDLFTQTLEIQLTPGARQSTPPTAVRIMRVLSTSTTANGTRRGVTRFNLRSMTAARPDWELDPPGRARQFSLVSDADVFYIYPPQPAPAHFAQVEAVVVPQVPRPTDPGYETATLDVDQRFHRALVDYVLYRTYSKDADVAGQSERALMHYRAYEAGTVSQPGITKDGPDS